MQTVAQKKNVDHLGYRPVYTKFYTYTVCDDVYWYDIFVSTDINTDNLSFHTTIDGDSDQFNNRRNI